MLEPQEYIRKYGIKKAREYYELIKNKPLFSFNADMPRKYKEAIEAYDLVVSYGGLTMAKRQYDCFDNARKSAGISQSVKVSALGKAITDLESCQ